jgi:hypothetical protein
LSQPSKCNLCQRKNISAAYHTICSGCAVSDKAWERVIAAKNSINKLEQKIDGETQVQETKKIERPQGAKACAMCCKEIALKDENDTQEMDQKIEEAKEKMILKLGRPLKLRESKAIERKIERAEEREKQRAKEERRRLREEAENKAKGRNTDQSNDEQTNLDPLKEDEHENKEEVDSSVHRIVSDDDEEEDEFLKKVGGSILTGEAYQEMLLQKEKLPKIKNCT